MCGICGMVAPAAGSGDELTDRLARMVDSLRHRGPDGHGQRVFLPPAAPVAVGLGHTRLSILDLSDAGLQPMTTEDESLWITYNGEIYNFQKLRGELEAKGYRFRTRTDTEVLLHLYREHGEDFLGRLNGMFALALLDLNQGKLLLARDPIGVKPLYYCQLDGKIAFGSEIKAVLASGVCSREVDRQAVWDYFTYLYVPYPATIFRDIRQLPPASLLTIDLGTGSSQLSMYWSVRRLPEVESASDEELAGRTRQLLSRSVEGQLISDVPLGIFLSGGIDSTTVAGLARESSDQVKTFTVVFEGDDYQYFNEQEVARAISRHLGTDHHEISVRPAELWSMLDLIDHFDQPFGNPTFYLMKLVSQHARERITVALCGAGGDELFAGYPRYRAAQLARRLEWVPALLCKLGRWSLSPLRDTGRGATLRRMRQFLGGLEHKSIERFALWTYYMGEGDKRRLIKRRGAGPADSAFLPSHRVLQSALDASPLADPDNRLLDVDVRTFLVDNLLEYTDKMSMAVGLESRVPLLDHEFVEFALNVPFHWKLDGGRSKILLRKVFADFLPEEAQKAPKKGFNAPLSLWVRETFDAYFEASQSPTHPLRQRLGEDIGITWRESGPLDWSMIQWLRDRHRRGRDDYSYELFAILVFDVWWRKYLT